MSVSMKGRILTTVLMFVCLAVTLTACGLQTIPGAGDQPEPQQPGGGGESQGPDDGPDPGPGSDPMDEQSEGPVEPEFGSDTLPCPPKGAMLYLGFDHALTINYGETSITHFLHEGWLRLMVVDEEGTIMPDASPSLTYSMEGKMSEECSLTSEGTMMPSAHGSCEAGVVSLFIEEDWLPLEGEMECIDTDGHIDIVPFNVPAMGLRKHSGQNGAGEIFYLVEGDAGYSTMRPFLEGEGYHTWTLYTEDMPIVPLVP